MTRRNRRPAANNHAHVDADAVTSSGGCDITDHADQQAKVSVTSAWSKPLRFAEAPQPSNLKKDVVAKMPIRQSTQQCLQRMDPKEVKEFRGPAYGEKKAQEDDGLLHRAQGIWRKEVGRKAAEYMRRRTAKKLKGKRSVSCKWMKKENQNRRARQKKQAKREAFVKLNKVYKTKLRVEWRREINEELGKSRREQAILKSAGANESVPTNGGTISKAHLSRKEAKKVRKANEKKVGHDIRKSRRERAVPKSAGGRHESYPTNGSDENRGSI